MFQLFIGLAKLLELYVIVLIIRILLSWFPNVNWYNQPFKFINDITEPFLMPFRRIIPPIGMFDISPIVAFILIQMLIQICYMLAFQFGGATGVVPMSTEPTF